MAPAALDTIVDETARLAQRFGEAGHRVYLVGGIVRDLLSGRNLSDEVDLDLTTDAGPDEIKALVGPLADALWLQGEKFGTIGARIDHRDYEITTHRSEVYTAGSRKPEVAFATAIDEDLSRRDFTVNAMAIELPGRHLMDPFGGAADLEQGQLRTPLDPEVSFTDDPLRMMRAARFTAGYDLVPAPGLVEAMESLRERLDIVSAERVRDELDKLLAVGQPATGLRLLSDTGLLTRFLPELEASTLDERGPAVDAMDPEPALRLAALLYGRALPEVSRRMQALRHSTERRKGTLVVLEAADRLATGKVNTLGTFRRWVAEAGQRRTDARTLVEALVPGGRALVERSRVLETEAGDELAHLGPALSGQQVMDILELREGPEIGEAMAYLQELRFDLGPIEAADAAARLRRWWQDRNAP